MTTQKYPKPSASVVLVSAQNQVLLLRRVQTSSAFPAAHVFPGGNISSFHEDTSQIYKDSTRHADALEYRLAAIRETFEESGILLARKKGCPKDGKLLELSERQRREGRKLVHDNKVKFTDWLNSVDGIAATDDLIPFTRWITPANVRRRFSTQMYLNLIPLDEPTDSVLGNPTSSREKNHMVPTPDGGREHTEAAFEEAHTWLKLARDGTITLFPPQLYLLSVVADHLKHSASAEELRQQRDSLLRYISTTGAPDTIPLEKKVISPRVAGRADRGQGWDDRLILDLKQPSGDPNRVVLVRFKDGAACNGEVAWVEDLQRRTAPQLPKM